MKTADEAFGKAKEKGYKYVVYDDDKGKWGIVKSADIGPTQAKKDGLWYFDTARCTAEEAIDDINEHFECKRPR